MNAKEHEGPRHETAKHEATKAETTKHEAAKAEAAPAAAQAAPSGQGGYLTFEPSVPAGGGGPQIETLGTIQGSASNADGATTTTAKSAFLGGGDVVTAQCTNPATGLINPCMVILLLSADDVTYYRVDSEWFGLASSGVYFAKFNMADYADRPDQFGVGLPWLWYKLQFTGNHGAAVTVAATNSGT